MHPKVGNPWRGGRQHVTTGRSDPATHRAPHAEPHAPPVPLGALSAAHKEAEPTSRCWGGSGDISTVPAASPPRIARCPRWHGHLLTPRLSRQDDPSAPHKLQDSLKSCLKDEEPFNIHSATSPKHDKGEQDGGEQNCLQNNLT